MAIHRGIAVTGKMLGKAEYAAVLQAADHTGGVFYYGAGGVAVATHADDGVGGAAVCAVLQRLICNGTQRRHG